MKDTQGRAIRISAVIYTSISLGLALAFLFAASAMGKYTATVIYGGAAWVFVLLMIVTMPTVTPWVKRRFKA